MFQLIIVILICVLLLSGVCDWIFDLVGAGFKVILSLVLIFASIYLGIKLFIVMIPWMFVIALAAFFVGIIWLIRALIRKK